MELLPRRGSRKGTGARAGNARMSSSFLALTLFAGWVGLQRSWQRKKQEGAGRAPGWWWGLLLGLGAESERHRESSRPLDPDLPPGAAVPAAARAGGTCPGEPSTSMTPCQPVLKPSGAPAGSARDSWLTPCGEAFRAGQNRAGACSSLARVATGPSGLWFSLFI